MKILTERTMGYQSFIERYDLNGALAGQDIALGVLLCWLLATAPETTFQRLFAQGKSDLGVPHEVLRIDSRQGGELLSHADALGAAFRRGEITEWDLSCIYAGAELEISGTTYGSVLGVSCPLTTPVNVLPLLSSVEARTYEFHSLGKGIVERMKEVCHLDQVRAVRALLKLRAFPDICAEFENGLKSTPFLFPRENAVTVCGYCAEELNRSYPLSVLGAYNYLIYLREHPEEAIADLKKGLPRK